MRLQARVQSATWLQSPTRAPVLHEDARPESRFVPPHFGPLVPL